MLKEIDESVMEMVAGKLDLSQFILTNQENFREHLCQLVGQALEQVDQAIMDSAYRRRFYSVKDKRERTYLASIGFDK